MYACIGKEKCNQCNILKNLLDEEGIQYHYVDMLEMPQKNYDLFENVSPSFFHTISLSPAFTSA